MFEKNMRIGYLLDIYGEALSDRKHTVLDRYYNEDLSLAEIAEELEISRQGVRELIKKAEEELFFLEGKLQIAARFGEASKRVERLSALLGTENAEVAKLLQELNELLKS